MRVPGLITIKPKAQLAKFLQQYGHRLRPSIRLELCSDPTIHFERSCLRDRVDQNLIYSAAIALGLRFPLETFIQKMCRCLGKPLGAINQNGMKVILGFMALNWVKGCKLSYRELFHMYNVHRGSESYYFSPKKVGLIEGIEHLSHDWDRYYL